MSSTQVGLHWKYLKHQNHNDKIYSNIQNPYIEIVGLRVINRFFYNFGDSPAIWVKRVYGTFYSKKKWEYLCDVVLCFEDGIKSG